MRHVVRVLFGALLAFALVWPASAQTGRVSKAGDDKKSSIPAVAAAHQKGDAVAGKLKADDERCIECHGHDGNANDIEDGVGNIGKFPRLAGQNADYIIKQFAEFRSGKRNNETMSVMAKSVSHADLLDIAAFFSSQKMLSGEARVDNPVGKKLFLNGDLERGILACSGCHGQNGKGAEAGATETPVVGGQHRRYLQKQLIEWRAGERHNSPGGIMNAITKELSDTEIDALADYVSGL